MIRRARRLYSHPFPSNTHRNASHARIVSGMMFAMTNILLKWHQFEAKQPNSGVLVAIKLADSKSKIHYGLGSFDKDGRMTLVAKPDVKGTLLPVKWTELPPE